MAIILPILLLVVLGTVQIAVWHHANNTARAAASACAERARGFDHSAGDGDAAARRTLEQVHGLSEATVAAVDDGFEVRCTVTGTAPTLVSLGPSISQTVTMPKERLR